MAGMPDERDLHRGEKYYGHGLRRVRPLSFLPLLPDKQQVHGSTIVAGTTPKQKVRILTAGGGG